MALQNVTLQQCGFLENLFRYLTYLLTFKDISGQFLLENINKKWSKIFISSEVQQK